MSKLTGHDKHCIKSSVHDMMVRLENQADQWILSIANLGKITNEEAVIVYNYYRKAKIIKKKGMSLDIIHGGFLDKTVIRRTLKVATK